MSTQAIVRTQLLNKTQLDRLGEISDEIKSADIEIIGGLQTAAQRAVTAGQLLIEAKAILKHGDFMGWCEKNTPYTVQHCRRWMTLAKRNKLVPFDTSEPVYKLLKASSKKPSTNSDNPKPSNFGIRLPLTRDRRRAYDKAAGEKSLVEWITGVLDGEIEKKSP